MSFKHPEFLYALFAVAIPIIIHLFNFRRYKKLWFSNIRFLKNITHQTRKQNKLKHLLVLLARILAYVFVVIAFAGPYFGEKEKTTNGSAPLTVIYVDNSFSMMAEGESGRLFDEALAQARVVVRKSPREARFMVLANNSGNAGRVLTKEESLNLLDEIAIAPDHKKLSSVIHSILKMKADKGYTSADVWLISDFQKNATDIDAFPEDSLTDYYFVPLEQAGQRNIFVDSCWINEPVILPGRPVTLNIRLKNPSSEDLEKIPMKVSIDGQQKAVAGADLKAASADVIAVSFSVPQPGWHTGLVEIEDYPVTFDDKLYFTFLVNPRIRVLEIHDGKSSPALQNFFSIDSVFSFHETGYHHVDFNRMNEYNLIILDGISSFSSGLVSQIKEYMERGGNVMFFPSKDTVADEDNGLLKALSAGRIAAFDTAKTRVTGINKQNDFFRDVIIRVPENADLPVVSKHFVYRYGIHSQMEPLVTMLNGDDFLLTRRLGKGQLYLLAVPLDEGFSNFISNALFVPVMYRSATQGNRRNELFYILGRDGQIRADAGSVSNMETPFTLQMEGGGPAYIPQQRLNNGNLLMDVSHGIKQAGFYDLDQNDSIWRIYAFNYNRDESQMSFYSGPEIKKALLSSGLKYYRVLGTLDKSFSQVVNAMQKENELWKLFIIFALLMLLAEALMLRLWK